MCPKEFEEIEIDDETMEDILKVCAETGDNPEALAERYVKFLKELRAQISPEYWEMRQIIDSYAKKEEYLEAV